MRPRRCRALRLQQRELPTHCALLQIQLHHFAAFHSATNARVPSFETLSATGYVEGTASFSDRSNRVSMSPVAASINSTSSDRLSATSNFSRRFCATDHRDRRRKRHTLDRPRSPPISIVFRPRASCCSGIFIIRSRRNLSRIEPIHHDAASRIAFAVASGSHSDPMLA